MSPTRLALLELFCTVALPIAILQFGTDTFGPIGVIAAASVPAAVFVGYQIARERTLSVLGALSLAGVGLSGGVALLQLDASWFAAKEALLPALLGLGTAATAWTRFPIVGAVLERVFDPSALHRARTGREAAWGAAVKRSTLELAVGTAFPGIVAYALARVVVQSAAGTEAYVAEVARYTAWSFPGVTIPGLVVTLLVLRRALARVEDALEVPFDELLPALTES